MCSANCIWNGISLSPFTICSAIECVCAVCTRSLSHFSSQSCAGFCLYCYQAWARTLAKYLLLIVFRIFPSCYISTSIHLSIWYVYEYMSVSQMNANSVLFNFSCKFSVISIAHLFWFDYVSICFYSLFWFLFIFLRKCVLSNRLVHIYIRRMVAETDSQMIVIRLLLFFSTLNYDDCYHKCARMRFLSYHNPQWIAITNKRH